MSELGRQLKITGAHILREVQALGLIITLCHLYSLFSNWDLSGSENQHTKALVVGFWEFSPGIQIFTTLKPPFSVLIFSQVFSVVCKYLVGALFYGLSFCSVRRKSILDFMVGRRPESLHAPIVEFLGRSSFSGTRSFFVSVLLAMCLHLVMLNYCCFKCWEYSYWCDFAFPMRLQEKTSARKRSSSREVLALV